MKSFLEEYGITIVVATIIMALISTATFFKTTGGNSLKAMTNNFLQEAQLAEAEAPPPGPVVLSASYNNIGMIQYEEGMTWHEWLNSNYGANYSVFVDNQFITPNNSNLYLISIDSENDTITGEESVILNCFVAGTQVTYDLNGHTKNIEDFQVGDDVVSYNLDTKEFYIAKVVDVTRHESEGELETTLAEVVFDNGSTLNMTLDHEILTTKGGRSVRNLKHPERELKVGDVAVTENGLATVTHINVYNCKPTPTYCLCVMDTEELETGVDDDKYDNFLAEGVVVHNARVPIEPGPYPGQIPEPSPYPEPEPSPEPNPYGF